MANFSLYIYYMNSNLSLCISVLSQCVIISVCWPHLLCNVLECSINNYTGGKKTTLISVSNFTSQKLLYIKVVQNGIPAINCLRIITIKSLFDWTETGESTERVLGRGWLTNSWLSSAFDRHGQQIDDQLRLSHAVFEPVGFCFKYLDDPAHISSNVDCSLLFTQPLA